MASQTPPAKRADGQGSIDDDVLYEILLSLPAKLLCRLRAVCRSWRSLLSAPSFIAAHTARQAAPLLIVHVHDASSLNVHVLDTSSGQVDKRIRVKTQSSTTWDHNSLMLMRTPHDLPLVHLPCADDELRLRVLDPVTGADFALPDVDHDKQHCYSALFMIGKVSSGDYKVLCLSMCTSVSNGQQLCKVLNLSGDRRWRDTACPPAMVRMGRLDGAAVNGVAYLLLTTIHRRRLQGSNGCIVAYDLEKEAWRPASLPIPVPSNKQRPRDMFHHVLAELSGCLALLYDDGHSFMELWFLVDPDKVTWSKQCTITVPYPYQGVGYRGEPLWLLDDGRLIIWIWRSPEFSNVLCMYDPRTMTYTDVTEMPNSTPGGVYTGSLLGGGSFHLLHQGGLVQVQ
ncbi:F-box protein At3g07870-like [Aegilops tauschii subsp. strangulata]|nr:F-box protein At3g07870-like [Aegilops tauschii subsp. strangulata]